MFNDGLNSRKLKTWGHQQNLRQTETCESECMSQEAVRGGNSEKKFVIPFLMALK